MAVGQFATLIQELGSVLSIHLIPDQNNSCRLRIPQGVSIQMEIDESREYFILCTEIGTLPVGKYREEILQEALQFNGVKEPRVGTFAYSSSADTLLLFKKIPIDQIDGRKIAEALLPLGKKGNEWKAAIDRGEHPHELSDEELKAKGKSGLFNLMEKFKGV